MCAPALTTMTIELRPITVADAEAHAAGEDDESVKWLSGGYAPIERVRDYLSGLEDNYRRQRGKRGFGIWVNGRLGGYIDFDPDREDGLAPGDVNIAYSVHPWARRRGVAVEAVNLLCQWMASWDIDTQAAIRVEPENVASVKVAGRVGFKAVGELISSTDVQADGAPAHLLLFRRPLTQPNICLWRR